MDTKAQTQPLPREATRSWKYEVEGMKRVDDEHRKVQEVIGQLNERISAVLGQQEAGFLAAYRAHMYNVQKELQALKARAARAENELQKNDKIQKLEEECEWYRKEALRLDEACTAFKKDLVYMKEKLETLEDDRAFLARQLKGAKKHAKLLRAEVDLAREEGVSQQQALFAEGGGEGVGQAWGGGGGGGGGGGSQASLGSAGGGGGGGGGLLLPDMRLAQSAPSHGLRGPAQQLERVRRDHGYVPQRPATQDPSKRSPKQARSMPAFLSTGGGGDGPGGSMEEMPQDVTQLQQQVRQLRRALADERRALRAARGAAARRGRRAQLQAFFLECVQDARRAAERRRAAARAAAAKGRPKTHAGSARPGQGPLDSVSSPGRGLDDARPDHDDPLAGPVGLEDLSATDRRGVMERLLLRDDVADAVYRMVFPDDGGGLPPGAGALTTHGITHDPAINRELRKYSDRQHRDARQPQSYGPAGDADYMGMEEDDFGFGPGRDDGARARGGAAGSMPALGGGGGGSSSARLLPLSAGTLRYLGKV